MILAALLVASTSGQALSATPDHVVEGNRMDAVFGTAVAPAGDVNGDGFSDVIVGAPRFANGEMDEGRAFVFLGSASGLSSVPVWIAEGDAPEAFFGIAVAAAGDVNGDGFDDVIVGAEYIQTDRGRAFVYLGSPDGPQDAAAWSVEGPAGSLFSRSVASAGDVNADGFDDLIVGAPFLDNGEQQEGGAFVYLGSAAGPSTMADWTAESNQPFAKFGAAVGTAGDVNGDGFDDAIVGAPGFNSPEIDEGLVFVYLGSASGLSVKEIWTAGSDQVGAELGGSVAAAGDVDGDGFGDVVVGARSFTNGEFGEGAAFLYLGSPTGPSASAATTLESDQISAGFGNSVATGGDVNGDGLGDVIVGAPSFSNGEDEEGRAFVYFGSSGGLSALPGLTAEGDQVEADFGFAVAGAGDVNGDGFGDLIVGAPSFDNGQANEGRAFVFLGAPSPPSTVTAVTMEVDVASARFGGSVASAGDVNGDGLSDVIVGARQFNGRGGAFAFLGTPTGLPASPDWSVEGSEAGSQFGQSVASAGDVNGDGFDDVIVGAPKLNGAGGALVYLGEPSSPSSPFGLATRPDWTVVSDQPDADFGQSVASAGDVNGDGYGDVIVGAPRYDAPEEDEGRAFIYLGSSDGLAGVPAWTAESDQPMASFGVSVAAAGDTNGDGFGDVVVGASQLPGGGGAFGYLGSASGPSTRPVWRVGGDGQAGFLGVSVAGAGDVNGDGFSDVIVGAPPQSGGPRGRAFLFTGSPAGPSIEPLWTAESGQDNSAFGASVAAAGDANGDGFGDVIVGAPLFFNGEVREGGAFVYLGSATGPSATPRWIAEGGQFDGQFGASVAAAGDVNGDGAGDLIVGAPQFTNGDFSEFFEGVAFAYNGNGGDGLSRPLRQLRVQDGEPIGLRGRSDADDAFALELLGRSAAGRNRVRLEWEVEPLGVPFDGDDVGRGTVADTGATGVELAEIVGGLDRVRRFCDNEASCASDADCAGIGSELCNSERAIFYHWRARVASDSPFFPRSPWRSLPGNSISETKLRTASPLAPPRFRLVGPKANERVFADADPLPFSWNRGAATAFRVEWSRNPDFEIVVETSGPLQAPDAGNIRVFLPDGELWRRILRLADSPDVGQVPIFWRIIPDGLSGADLDRLEVRALRMSPARPVLVLSPPQGAEVEEDRPPRLVWEANHNERYRVVFSATSHLGFPRVESAPDATIEEAFWQMPPDKWAEVVELARSDPDGNVFFVVFGRDALDRLSIGSAHALRVLFTGSANEGRGLRERNTLQPRRRRLLR